MIIAALRCRRSGHAQVALFVAAIPPYRDEAVLRRRQVDARGVAREVGTTATGGARDQRRSAALGAGGRRRIPDEVRLRGDARLVAATLCGSLQHDDARTVARPRRLTQHAGAAAQCHDAAAARRRDRRLVEATTVVGPGDPRQRATIR